MPHSGRSAKGMDYKPVPGHPMPKEMPMERVKPVKPQRGAPTAVAKKLPPKRPGGARY